MTVLLVEDDPDQRFVLSAFLRGAGHEVTECASAREAEEAEACEVAFVDRNLPDADGIDLARRLGGRVFLLTGEDLPHELKVRLQSAGVALVVKPVRPKDFERLLG